MVGGAYVPDRGDTVWLNFTPQTEHEQAGHRPALVLSPRAYNQKTGLALCCPITSRAKGYPFEVSLPARGTIEGVVLADQVKSLDWRARNVRFGNHAPPQVISEVLAKIHALLD